MAEKIKFQTVDEYIKTFPKNIQKVLNEIRQLIKKTAPGADETISYNIPAFKLNGGLVYFAGWKTHIGLYPISGAIEKKFKKELATYKIGKGSIQFPLDKPIPLPLIKKIVEYRVRENLEKVKKK